MKPSRTVWKPQPRRPIADWLGLENKASATRGRQGPIPGSETPPYIYKSDNPLEHGDLPGRNRPARCGNPSHTGRSVTAHSGEDRIGFHPRIRNPSIPLQLRQLGDENNDPLGRNRPARCVNPSPTGRSLIGWGSYIEPAHPEVRFPSPDYKSFQTFTTQTTLGQKW